MNWPGKNRIAGTIIATIVLTALTQGCSGRGGEGDEAEAPEPQVVVSVIHPDAVADTLILEAQGIVMTRRSSSVIALSEGMISSASVSVGQPVRKGQSVALLENGELDNELSHQSDKLQSGKQSVADLEKRVVAAEEMFKLGVVSESELVTLKQELNAGKAEMNDQAIAFDRLTARVKNYRVVSTVDGYISSILPEKSYVTYGQAVAEVVSLADEQIEAFVPFDNDLQPSPGDKANIICNNRVVSGTVSSVYPAAEANLIRVIVIPSEPLPMNLGVTVAFRIRPVSGLVIPKSALVIDEGKPVVYVVRNDSAYKTDITIAKDYLDRVVISAGLEPDDVLVTENAYLLSDQMNVTVK